jgi:hypothetical protein
MCVTSVSVLENETVDEPISVATPGKIPAKVIRSGIAPVGSMPELSITSVTVPTGTPDKPQCVSDGATGRYVLIHSGSVTVYVCQWQDTTNASDALPDAVAVSTQVSGKLVAAVNVRTAVVATDKTEVSSTTETVIESVGPGANGLTSTETTTVSPTNITFDGTRIVTPSASAGRGVADGGGGKMTFRPGGNDGADGATDKGELGTAVETGTTVVGERINVGEYAVVVRVAVDRVRVGTGGVNSRAVVIVCDTVAVADGVGVG